MKRANSAAVRTAVHEMALMNQMLASLGMPLLRDYYDQRVAAIRSAVNDDDLYDPRVVRQKADGTWEDISDAP